MSKTKAARILGGLTLAGVLVLTSLVVAGGNEKSYFADLKGAFTRGCVELVDLGLRNLVDEDEFLAACSFVIETLKDLKPGDSDAEIQDAFLDALRREMPGLSRRSTCTECVQAVQEFEGFLAANGTVPDIVDGMKLGCEKRFSKPADIDQCQEAVDANVPVLVDVVLSEFPPLTACRALNFCPPPD